MTTSDKKMISDMLDFHIRNKEHFLPWEDKKPDDYYTYFYHMQMVKSEKAAIKRGDELDFWIFRLTDGKLIGKVVLFSISFGNVSSAVLGYKLDSQAQKCGYMHEAINAVVCFAFNELNLHRLEINIIPRNERSIKVAEAAGFSLEGKSEKFMRINGVWEDHLRFVKINDSFKEDY